LFFINPGKISAINTNNAVMIFRSLGFNPQRSAMATSNRNNTDPKTVQAITNQTLLSLIIASQIITLANPQTIIPIPI